MDMNNEIRDIKMISLFSGVIMLLSLAIIIYSFYLPYFTIKGHNVSFYNYTVAIYQEMPLVTIVLLVVGLVQILLLFALFGAFQLKEQSRRALIFISLSGIIIYVLLFFISKIIGQRLPLPIMSCLVLSANLYFFTRQKIREQFK